MSQNNARKASGNFLSAERITAFLHHIVIDVGEGVGEGREVFIMGSVYLKDDVYSEKMWYL